MFSYTFTGDEITAVNPEHTFDVSLSGYTPVDAHIVRSCDNQAYAYNCIIEGNSVKTQFHSIRSTPANNAMPIGVRVLYIRTGRV